ncbi:MAG TPA: tRNA 2-thiouridine(34) synthase MnmA [Chitinophagales bacterium]|nr:tRNA 2-thiouridine(34) synthase MnmA [Chitinophagales bacterium]HRK28644.1 tRNA 2-thiouridine(34) synthase MnmA [Chitinophagales bacterium]
MSKHGRVLVAMSGGIDSTVTAAMLHEQGYEVIGITMKTWDYATSGGSKKETGCCSLDSINDARSVAVDFGFHHFIIDIREEFGDWVIENFVEEYIAGRTPNPCILCNTHIKWAALLRRADALDCEFIATGHYAQKRYENGRYLIYKGVDELKDQSYVLWGLQQQNLARTMFPVGGFRKPEIRQMAMDWGYTELAQKSESYEICFIPDNDYRGFLKRRVPDLEQKVKGGKFVSVTGELLGTHDGYPFFTIGQRKGLGIALGKPVYVVKIIPETNTVVLGEEEDVKQNAMWVRNINMVKYPDALAGMETITKIRSHHIGAPAYIKQEADRMNVVFHEWVDAIAPGQSAVFYEGNDVIGGGHIEMSYDL